MKISKIFKTSIFLIVITGFMNCRSFDEKLYSPVKVMEGYENYKLGPSTHLDFNKILSNTFQTNEKTKEYDGEIRYAVISKKDSRFGLGHNAIVMALSFYMILPIFGVPIHYHSTEMEVSFLLTSSDKQKTVSYKSSANASRYVAAYWGTQSPETESQADAFRKTLKNFIVHLEK